jgi:hypothetical protein
MLYGQDLVQQRMCRLQHQHQLRLVQQQGTSRSSVPMHRPKLIMLLCSAPIPRRATTACASPPPRPAPGASPDAATIVSASSSTSTTAVPADTRCVFVSRPRPALPIATFSCADARKLHSVLQTTSALWATVFPSPSPVPAARPSALVAASSSERMRTASHVATRYAVVSPLQLGISLTFNFIVHEWG